MCRALSCPLNLSFIRDARRIDQGSEVLIGNSDGEGDGSRGGKFSYFT